MALTASSPTRGEALCLHVGRLRLEVRALRRADPPLPKTHGTAPLPLPALPACFFALGSPGLAHEASPLSTPTSTWTFPGWNKNGATQGGFPSNGPFPRLVAPQIHRKIKDWPIDRTGEASNGSSYMSLATGSQRDFLQTQTQRNKATNKWTQMDTQTLGTGDRPSENWTLRLAHRWPWTAGGVVG